GPVDGRWEAFGLNQPGLKQAPKKPENVSVVLEGETAASVKWSPAPRASHYRVWVKVVGVDDEAKPVGRAGDFDFTIENLPPSSEVEVSVSAVNSGGESAASNVVLVRTMQPPRDSDAELKSP
ncbi:MAG: fibronectin type III domain-containing protein, partial [Limisphaerales bacterium]